MTELPLFPLSAVLMPMGRMPLRIFEQRYLDLVRDSMRSDSAFGIVWIRRGAEVAQRGRVAPELGDYGTCARIVDWDQLPDGLLGITVEGNERFDLYETLTRANGLVVGQVEVQPPPAPEPMSEDWLSVADVLRSLESHPQVQRLNLRIDYNNAWQVACSLVQLMPIEEALKYEFQGIEDIAVLMGELQSLLRQISGET